MRQFWWVAAATAAGFAVGGATAHATRAAEIPACFRDGFVWVEVEVRGGGDRLHFVFDTGAESSVIDLGAARRLGLGFGGSVGVEGVCSRAVARRVRGFEAAVAGVALPSAPLALDLRAVSRTCHWPIDGLVGADFLRGRIVQVDFAAGRVRLLDGAPTGERCEAVPMRWRGGGYCVAVGVGGSRPRWMRVDTGCDSALEWAGGAIGARPRSSATIGLAAPGAGSVSADVQLGARTIRDVRVGVHRSPIFAGEAGLIGTALLSNFRVTLDAPGRRLVLEDANAGRGRLRAAKD